MNILLIKLGALGDVLRTTPLLTALKKKYPDSEITWIVDASHREILEGNPWINRLMDSSAKTDQWLKTAQFDLAINLDKEPEATGFMASAKALKKMGFICDAKRQLAPADSLSEYAYRLGIDDDLKFRKNKKTYQEISFEQLGLSFCQEEYLLSLGHADVARARDVLKALGADPAVLPRPIVGLNTGSGTRFAGKKLPPSTYAKIAEMLHEKLKATIFLLGGEDERESNHVIAQKARCPTLLTGSHSIKTFAALVKVCDLVVTGDTTAMHIAIAVQTPVVAYFASTCAGEIELYGRGRKVISGISCAPCYKKICPIDEQCMKEMAAENIFREIKTLWEERHATRFS
jgi:heptosyltransferase-2